MGSGCSRAETDAENLGENGRAVYQVSLTMDKEVETEFTQWLTTHTAELKGFPGYIKSEYYKGKDTKPTVVFVLGGPGSGKGTQCERIVKEFGFGHISAGDCLREEQASGSKDAELINQYITEGRLVPIEIVIRLLIKAMSKSDKNKFLIDGFPRSLENYEGWNAHVGDQANVAFVLYMDCPENVMEVRLLERGKTSGRADDNIESIKKRFHTFQNETKPIVELYEKENKLRRMHAEKDQDGVWEEVKTAFTELQQQHHHHLIYTVQYHFENYSSLRNGEKEILPKMQSNFPAALQEKVHMQTRYLLDGKEL